VRYADDFLVGFIGTRAEAEAIKEAIGRFLSEELGLELSQEKTLITHASKEKARFLNYEITIGTSECRKAKVTVEGTRTRRRSVNGRVILLVPHDVIQTWKAKVTKRQEARERAELIHNSDFDIISTYERELQGLINYYSLAQNVARAMYSLRYYYKKSLVRTLATKFKTKTAQIYKKYTKLTADGKKVIGVEIQREGKKPLRATFGTKPIRQKDSVEINDNIVHIYTQRNELLERLVAEHCELCGKQEKVVGHHIHKLKHLRKKKRELQTWEKKMIAMRRKSLFVCETCHKKIHNGTYDGIKLTQA
jgi:hypothetical protein